MKVIQTTALVGPSGAMNVSVDVDVPTGRHRVVLIVEEAPLPEPPQPPTMDDWPVHDVGPWPEGLSLRREDLYGDDGR